MAVKKKNKTKDNSIIPLERVKVVDMYPDLFFGREQPINEAIIDRLTQEMVEFAEREDTIRPSQFWMSKRLNSAYIYRWKEKWPQLQNAYDYLMAWCAQRRDIGAATRKYDGNYIEKNQPMYDPEYKKLVEWRAGLANKDKESQGTVVVQMMPSPTSDAVPERKRADD